MISSAKSIVIGSDFSQQNLEPKIQCNLSEKDLNFQTVKKQFFKDSISNHKTFNNEAVLWAKFELENNQAQIVKLAIRCSKFSDVQLFNQEGKLLGESGLLQKNNQRQSAISAISQINFSLNQLTKETFYLRLKLKDDIGIEYEPFPISLFNSDQLQIEQTSKNNFLLFFLGGIILMTLYNLALYFQVGRIHYLYFVLLNLMIFLFVFVQTGKIENTFFENYFYHERLIMVVGNLNLVAYILFSDKILNLSINHPKVSKLKNYIIPILIALNIPVAFGFLIPILFGIGSLMALVVYNYVIYASFKAVRRGDSSVSFFFIGNLFFYIGTTVSVLMINDILPRSLWNLTAIEVVEIGNLIQLSLFSLSMGAIIKEIEKRLSQSETEKEFAFQTANFKDQFLANMSHEIRTPLNGIIGMLDVFYASHELDDKQKEQLGVVKSSSHSLLGIINDILDLSKLQAGKMTLSPVNTDLSKLTSATQKLFKPLASEKNLELSIVVAPEIPQYIIIDELRVKQIINNLTSNAIKFTKEGSVKIKIEIQNNQLLISITDTGVGIEEAARSKIFEEFAQVDETNKRRIDGTGLGLSISTKLSKLMGGQIGVESEVGKGSKFWFTLDFETGRAEQEKAKRNVLEKKDLALKILIVEDKPVNQKVAQLMLKKLGHSSEVANNGLQCLAMFEEDKYHIILMDVQMPEMDGVEASQILKKKYNNLPPIIGLSANSMEGDAEKYISLGFDDYLAKPITLDGLRAKIDEYIPEILSKNS